MLSAICFNLDQSKILSSGNGLSDEIKKYMDIAHQEYMTKKT